MPTWTFEEWPLRDQPDELLGELYTARAPLHAEARPGDPRRPLADEIVALRHGPALQGGVRIIARDAGAAIAGWSTCSWEDLPGLAHALTADIEVLPDRRRLGLGSLLLGRSAAVAQRRGQRMIMGRTRDNVSSGAAFAQRFGAEVALVSQENRLDLHAVDRDLVRHWLADGPARAPGYRLHFVAGPTPPELLDRVAGVFNVMNTAPTENMDVSDAPLTPDVVRAYESAIVAAGDDTWAYYAAEEASGRLVGLTNITITGGVRDRVHVGDTGVEPAHRGRALGKWLKAAITERILADLPEVRWVIASNAGSNDAMLKINTELGFRTVAVHTRWQIPTDQLLARLAAGLAAVDSGAD